MSTKENRDFINFLRGLAIFLMLWGHCIQYCCGEQFDFFENSLFKIIYSFHMPLFMLISGYLFYFSSKKRDFTELINYKVTSLLYPILMCSILNMLITTGVFAILDGKYVYIVSQISMNNFWFLWSIISASLAVSIAVKTTNNHIIQIVLLPLGIAIVPLFPYWQENIYMYPFFVAGYLFGRNEEKLKSKFDMLGLICLIAFVITLYLYINGFISNTITGSGIKKYVFKWFIGLCGSIAVIYIAKSIKVFKYDSLLVRGIEFLGRNSLAIYMLSCALLSFWLPILTDKVLNLFPFIDWNKYIVLYNFVITPAISVLYSISLSLIVIVMKKLKIYKIVFGR